MNRLAVLGVVVTALATAGVCYVAMKPGLLSTPTIDGSSEAAFKVSLDAVKASLPTDQHAAFESAMSAHARAALLPEGDGANPLSGLMAVSADKDGPARRLRARIDGLNAQQIINTASNLATGGGELTFPLDFGRARMNANESAAIATLKNISSAQTQCQASGIIDRNGNGAGEYGYFAELSGAADIVGSDGKSVRVKPAVLSSAFSNVKDGQVVRSGYVFQMYLPGAQASFVAEGGKADPSSSEVLWCCYAWPSSYGNSGERVFFVNQSGDVLGCRNSAAKYSGTTTQPLPLAAFLGTEKDMGGMIAANTVGTDGETWVVVN